LAARSSCAAARISARETDGAVCSSNLAGVRWSGTGSATIMRLRAHRR
jgi:hypothetical protein